MGKKLFAFVLIFALCSTNAFAAETTMYEVDNTGITISIPSSDYVITQNTPLTAPVFSFLGISNPQSVIDQNMTNGILIDVVNPNFYYEIVIGSPALDNVGFSSLSDFDQTTINQTIESMKSQFENNGIALLEYEICQDYAQPYLVLDISQQLQGQTLYSQEYYTIVNGTALYVTLHELSGSQVSADNIQTLKTVVSSVSFPQPQTTTLPEQETTPTSNITDETSDKIPFSQQPLYSVLVNIVSGIVSFLIILGIVTAIQKIKSKR